MKITNQQLETMRNAMRAVVEHLGGVEKVKAAFSDFTPRRMLWDIWHKAEVNLRYDDSHPFFVGGRWERMVPHNPSFATDLNYLKGCHIETALAKIGREFGLLP